VNDCNGPFRRKGNSKNFENGRGLSLPRGEMVKNSPEAEAISGKGKEPAHGGVSPLGANAEWKSERKKGDFGRDSDPEEGLRTVYLASGSDEILSMNEFLKKQKGGNTKGPLRKTKVFR